MRKKRKTIEANYCELCGRELKFDVPVELKDKRYICSKCYQEHKKDDDPKRSKMISLEGLAVRKSLKEEEARKEQERLESQRRYEEEKTKMEKERLANLDDEIIIDDVLLIGNKRAEMQEALDYCSEGDPVTITWEVIQDEYGIEYSGDMLIVIHDYSGREIGRLKQTIQEKLVSLSKDYIFDGKIEKLGENGSGKLYAVITIIAELKNKT